MTSMLENLQLPSLEERRKQLCLIFLYKVVEGLKTEKFLKPNKTINIKYMQKDLLIVYLTILWSNLKPVTPRHLKFLEATLTNTNNHSLSAL